MKQNETEWNRMKQNETEWNGMKRNETEWNGMKRTWWIYDILWSLEEERRADGEGKDPECRSDTSTAQWLKGVICNKKGMERNEKERNRMKQNETEWNGMNLKEMEHHEMEWDGTELNDKNQRKWNIMLKLQVNSEKHQRIKRNKQNRTNLKKTA